ncbi:MAG: response regulator [Candidatus Berkelbacteria bacterium]
MAARLQKRILVVTDNHILRNLIENHLRRDKFKASAARTGEHAVELMQRIPEVTNIGKAVTKHRKPLPAFDLIIVDVNITEVSAALVLDWIHQEDRYIGIPVILIVNSEQELLIPDGHGKRRLACVAQPFDIKHFVQMVEDAVA